MGFNTVKELETDQGILASSKNELYGAIFGRDSLITSLQLLKVYQETGMADLLLIVQKVLTTLIDLQGTQININSGEEPGKIIHEFRPDKHEHLTRDLPKPWYLYPDQVMRNYDSVDSTPLFLIALYRYLQIRARLGPPDQDFDTKAVESAHAALDWILLYGDSNSDGFIDFILNPAREFGGLQNQNWMDSTESVFHEDGSQPIYPIAPVEAQSYTYLALKLWSKHLQKPDPDKSLFLKNYAQDLKHAFNQNFISVDKRGWYLASGLDGSGERLKSVRSSMGHALWASQNRKQDSEIDGIVENKFVPKIVARLLKPDMLVPQAGIRTLSTDSVGYNPNSYHNGSIWPHDTSLIADGFESYGYHREARRLRQAVLSAIKHFQTPLELFVYDHTYQDYLSDNGQTSCKKQAWSAAAVLSSVSSNYSQDRIWFSYMPLELFAASFKRPLTGASTFSKKVLTTTLNLGRQIEPVYSQLNSGYSRVKNTLLDRFLPRPD